MAGGGSSFKFKWLDANGRPSGFGWKVGRVTDDALAIGKNEIPFTRIVAAHCRFDRVVIETVDSNARKQPLAFAVKGGDAERVQAALNRAVSKNVERAVRGRAAAEGRDAELRVRFVACPHCGSRADVTPHAKTPETWCPWCSRLATAGAKSDEDEARHRLCANCGFYGSLVEFTDFFFWFVLIAYGVSWTRKYMCRPCMRSVAWIMVAKNVIFVAGVPFAAAQVVRAYAGGSMVEGKFAGLGAANAQARGKAPAAAVRLYEDLEGRLGGSAGVAYCRALASERSRDDEGAVEAFRDALKRCGNFWPAYHRLATKLRRLGRVEELAALRRSWDDREGLAEDAKLVEAASRPARVARPVRRSK